MNSIYFLSMCRLGIFSSIFQTKSLQNTSLPCNNQVHSYSLGTVDISYFHFITQKDIFMFEDNGCHLRIDQWNDTYGKSIQIFYLYQIPNKNWQKEEISSLSIWSADHLMWIKKKKNNEISSQCFQGVCLYFCCSERSVNNSWYGLRKSSVCYIISTREMNHTAVVLK